MSNLRAELLAAAAKICEGEVWVNHNGRVAFMCDRDFSGTHIFRTDQADLDPVGATLGNEPVIVTAYLMFRSAPGIFRDIGGGPVPASPEDTPRPERRSLYRKWAEARKTYKMMRRGFLDADETEIRELIAQINGAELRRPGTTEGN